MLKLQQRKILACLSNVRENALCNEQNKTQRLHIQSPLDIINLHDLTNTNKNFQAKLDLHCETGHWGDFTILEELPKCLLQKSYLIIWKQKKTFLILWFWLCCTLTHWVWDKMAAVSQTTLPNAFSWIKMLELWLRFHWSLFLRIQLTIIQHWFR